MPHRPILAGHFLARRLLSRRLLAPLAAGLALVAVAGPVAAQVNAPASAQPAKPATANSPAKPATKPAAKPAASKASPVSPDPAFSAYQRGKFKTAFDLAVQRANRDGDPASMVLVGELLSQGYGVRQDGVAARKWFEAAAAKGNADALFTLAAMDLGRGALNKDNAVDRLRQAAEKGNAAAAYNLGLIYLEGQVAPKEPAIAAGWFQRAADLDQPDALYALATLYRDGHGVPKDPVEMARLLQRADIVGNRVATTEYAIAVFNGFGVPKDEERAAELFRKAALAGNAIAQNRYARILSAGRGVPQDLVAAAAWHLAAKAQKLDDPALDKMMEQLTPQQRTEAQQRLAVWNGTATP